MAATGVEQPRSIRLATVGEDLHSVPDAHLSAGGEGILDWWCTEQADAFSADQPVYVTMEAELRRV